MGEGHPDYAVRLNNLANLLTNTGRHEEAEPLYRQALEIGRETLGEGHPDYAVRLCNFATLLANMGRHEAAEPLLRQALEVGMGDPGRKASRLRYLSQQPRRLPEGYGPA